MARDMSYLKDMPIAILGCGGVGKTMAGDCALAGQEVRIWEQEAFKKNFNNIERTGIKLTGNQFSYYGFERRGVGYDSMASTNMAEVVKGAGIIIIATVAMAHENICRELVTLLEDGQVVHFFPDNCGTFVMRKVMREMNFNKDVIVGAWYTAPYGVRIVRRGGVTTNECKVEDHITTIRGAALPATDTDDFIASADYIAAFDAIRTGDGFVKGNTVIDVKLSNVNSVIHVPGTVLGAAVMQNFDTVLAHDELLEVACGLLGVELERILSLVCQLGIEAVEVPVACLDGLLFLGDGEAHGALHVVLDARAVADDEGRSVIGLSLADGTQCLVGVGTQRDLCDVDVTIAHGHHAQVFLPGHLAACCELGDCRCSSGLGGLAAGVRVNFGVEDQDVDILAGRGGSDQTEAGVADCHDVGVVTEDGQSMCGQGTCGNMEDMPDPPRLKRFYLTPFC